MKDKKLTKIAIATTIITYAYLIITPHLFMQISSNIHAILLSTSFFPLIVGSVLLKFALKYKDRTSILLSGVTLISPVIIFGLYFLFH